MSTTTVRLNSDDERILDRLASRLGGRSSAIRQALRLLSAEVDREEVLDEFLTEWEAADGPVDEEAVSVMARRYGL
jgi:predicted transcriptional regulator